jgi:hypothetical protein
MLNLHSIRLNSWRICTRSDHMLFPVIAIRYNVVLSAVTSVILTSGWIKIEFLFSSLYYLGYMRFWTDRFFWLPNDSYLKSSTTSTWPNNMVPVSPTKKILTKKRFSQKLRGSFCSYFGDLLLTDRLDFNYWEIQQIKINLKKVNFFVT